MTSAKLKQARQLRHLALLEEEIRLDAMGCAQATLDHAQARINELSAYVREYSASLALKASKPFPAHIYKDQQDFLVQVNRLIAEQQRICEQAKKNFDATTKEWLLARNKLKVIEKLVDKRRRDDIKEQDKLDQLDVEGFMQNQRHKDI